MQVGLNVVLYSGVLEARLVFLMILLCLFCKCRGGHRALLSRTAQSQCLYRRHCLGRCRC